MTGDPPRATPVEALAAFARAVAAAPADRLPHLTADAASPLLAAEVTLRAAAPEPAAALDPFARVPPAPADTAAGAADAVTLSLAVPLVVDGRLWGHLRAVRRPAGGDTAADDFSDHDRACADLLAALLTGALERELPSSPVVGNRRALDETTERLLGRAARDAPRRVSAVSVSVSGEEATVGDVASLLMRHFGVLPGGLVARVADGGFVVLVADHPVADVAAVTDEFCSAAAALGAEVFCGLASTTGAQPWETAEHLLSAADRACERARRHERHAEGAGGYRPFAYVGP